MANFTKKAIRASFIKLLNEKPLTQITVRDIVEDCGVNRNTFYYYYQDLPQLMENIVNEDAERIIRILPSIPWTIVSMQHWNLLWPIGKRCFISIIPSTETFMSNTNGGSVLMWSGRM